MIRIRSLGAASLVALMSAASAANAENTTAQLDGLNGLDILTVIGVARDTSNVAGSVTFIPPEQLAVQKYTDIHRILRQAPGVNMQEEDGYGLRPNIGIRGSGLDRSSKVVIMEDGVLMAPAPYAAPSAYYFPFSNRMNAVEIAKGPATVKYGPNTTAGAVQFFSTPIPDEPSAHVTALASSQDRFLTHAWAGGKTSLAQLPFDVGFLAETYQDSAEGFKEIENGDTGFRLQDYVGKLGLFSKDGAKYDQSLVFKFQYSDERSDETYLGLTQSDIAQTPYLRYNASQLDQMNTEHYTYQLTHNIELSDAVEITTIAYNTEFTRNWEKLDRFDNSDALFTGGGACNSLNEILVDPTTCATEFQVLVGPVGFTSPDDVLGIRQNNRSYYAKGVQSAANFRFDALGFDHDAVVSIRYHEDSVDRFQEQDQYRIDNGIVIKTTDNAPGTQANRFSKAQALSIYIEDTLRRGPVAITGGVRFESVDTMQERWNTPDRTLAPDSIRQNSYDIFLPSLSVLFDVTDNFSLLAGAHRGFAAASVSSSTQDPEESIAYEAGARFANRLFSVEAIGFFNDYSNLIAECTNSSGGSECVIGETDNAGEADVYGLEFVANSDLADVFQSGGDLSFPIAVTYTYTSTEFKSTSNGSIFGPITAGDELPYVPDHQLYLSAGVNGADWGVNANLSYLNQTRAVPGQGAIATLDSIDARAIVDLAAYYEIADGVRLRVKVENLFDEAYVAARRPYGARPGKPREIFGGLSIDL